MEHLLCCREEFDNLASLANEGKLAEAVQASARLQSLLDAAPPTLKEAEVFTSLKVRLFYACSTWVIKVFYLGHLQDSEGPHRRTTN